MKQVLKGYEFEFWVDILCTDSFWVESHHMYLNL